MPFKFKLKKTFIALSSSQVQLEQNDLQAEQIITQKSKNTCLSNVQDFPQPSFKAKLQCGGGWNHAIALLRSDGSKGPRLVEQRYFYGAYRASHCSYLPSLKWDFCKTSLKLADSKVKFNKNVLILIVKINGLLKQPLNYLLTFWLWQIF